LRKIVSALLILIFLFNLFGYQLVTNYMQRKADTQLESRLDNNRYEESQLIEIKVPLNLPYQTSWSAFERYDGEVEMNGILYKYVKRKLANDTLILLCIPNQQKMDLQTARDDFFKNTNGLSQNNSKKSGNSNTGSCKKLMSEYDGIAYIPHINSSRYQQVFSTNYLAGNLVNTPHLFPEQPPDFPVV
jgi:hypothetical protein